MAVLLGGFAAASKVTLNLMDGKIVHNFASYASAGSFMRD